MDLATVKDKLENYCYLSKVAFLGDLNQIWDNCLRYHTTPNHPLRRKALAMHQKTREIMPLIPNVFMSKGALAMHQETTEIMPLIPNVVMSDGTDINAEERQLHDSVISLYNGEDSDNKPVMSPRGRLTLASEDKSSLDQSIPADHKPLPPIGENQDVPLGEASWVYDDGTTGKRVILGEAPQTQQGITNAGKSHKRRSAACMACRLRKMKCDIAEPKCSPCKKSGRRCISRQARPRYPTQSSPELNEVNYSYPFVSSHDLSGAYETPASGAATNRVPVSSLLADSNTALQQSKNAVDGSIPPTNKEHRCPYCSTSFNRHHNLKRHLLTHNQDRAYVCGTCEARFRRSHDLKRHTKLHTCGGPHVCPNCNQAFASIDAFASHFRERHNHRGINAGGERRNSEGNIDNVFSANPLPLTRSRADVDDVGLKPQTQMPPRVASTDLWVGSGWSSENDKTLLRARKEGLDWHTIVSQHFPESTANAIRNQHTSLLLRNEIGSETQQRTFEVHLQALRASKASQIRAIERAKSPPPDHKPTREHTAFSQPYFDSLDCPTTISPNDWSIDHPSVQGEKGISNDESTSYKGKPLYGDDDEQRHPSLTRERHPIYGNSLFSENHSVYGADNANELITELLFERQVAKGSTLPTYSDPSGGSKRRAARSVSLETLNELTPSQRPSHTTIAATSGSAYETNNSTYGGEVEEPQRSPKIFKCSHTDCVRKPPLFSRESEWT